MKKDILLVALLVGTMLANAQPPAQNGQGNAPMQGATVERSSLQLDINTMDEQQAAHINDYIEGQRGNRAFGATLGTALLGTIVSSASNITISEIVKLTQIRKNHKEEWNKMVKNECQYTESLTYIDNLTDFYSDGSTYGALDPDNLRFNGFTLNARNGGADVLRFYCHVNTDTDGLNEIFNHSKFRLVLDSLYFYPYRCHLPNMSANQMFPEKGKDYGRSTRFSFEERDNLMVSINFSISSSWYNEAIILAKDVELGTFSVQIPIDERSLTDSVFVYKAGTRGVKPLAINGDCFIVPRSYMPLPGGVAHWGTGEYNIKVTLTEQCNISKQMEKEWHRDYHRMKRMKKDKPVQRYFVDLYTQNGNTILRQVLETTSSTALGAAGLSTRGTTSGNMGNAAGGNAGGTGNAGASGAAGVPSGAGTPAGGGKP